MYHLIISINHHTSANLIFVLFLIKSIYARIWSLERNNSKRNLIFTILNYIKESAESLQNLVRNVKKYISQPSDFWSDLEVKNKYKMSKITETMLSGVIKELNDILAKNK